jgi:MFS family permease
MLPLSLLTFFSFGVTLVLVGANQDRLAHDLGIGLAETGLLASALAAGAGFGITAAGPLFDRLPRRWLLASSTLLVAVALGSMGPTLTLEGAALRIAIAGMGAGGYNTIINAGLAEGYGARSHRVLAAVHSAATVGAMLGPLLASWVAQTMHWSWSFRLAGAAHGLVALGAPFVWPKRNPKAATSAQVAGPLPWLRLAPFLAVTFCYVAIEATATTFAVPFAVRDLQLSPARGQWAISALWLGVLASRLGMMLSPRAIGPRALVAAGAAGATVIALATLTQLRVVEVFFGVFGAAIGLVYPLVMSIIGERFERHRGMAAGLAGGAGAVGAVVLPWAAGVIGDWRGVGTAIAWLVAPCLVVALGGLAITIDPQRRGRAPR